MFQSVKGLMATLLGALQTRLELFSTEFEEERVRLTSMLVWVLAGLFFAGLSVIFLALLIVAALWETNKLLAISIPMFLFMAAAIVSVVIVRSKASAKPRLFAATLAELAKDRDRLTPRP